MIYPGKLLHFKHELANNTTCDLQDLGISIARRQTPYGYYNGIQVIITTLLLLYTPFSLSRSLHAYLPFLFTCPYNLLTPSMDGDAEDELYTVVILIDVHWLFTQLAIH